MTTSTPVIKPESNGLLQRLNTFLDKRVLPYPVMFLSNRVIILATLALLVPLIFFNGNQAFVNVLNSYLNVMSVVVSSTVLLYATIADVRDRAAAKRAEEIAKAYEQELEERVQGREEMAKAYEQVLERRVQIDHDRIEQLLQLKIDGLLGQRLEKIRLEDRQRLEAMERAVIASNESLRAELAEKALLASNESLRAELAALTVFVQALYESYFGKSTTSGR